MTTPRKKTKSAQNPSPLSARKLIRRLSVILRCLQHNEAPAEWEGSRRDWRHNSSHFAQAFGCSERTIMRDIKILRDLGHQIQYDEKELGFTYRRSGCTAIYLPVQLLCEKAITAQPLQHSEASNGIWNCLTKERERHEEYTVRLRASHRIAPFMRELKFKGLHFEPLTASHQEFIFPTYDLQIVEILILKWAPEIEAIEPPELRKSISARARLLSHMHD